MKHKVANSCAHMKKDSLLTDFLGYDTIAIYFTAHYHSVIPNTEVEEGWQIKLQNALRNLSLSTDYNELLGKNREKFFCNVHHRSYCLL